jgi:hypothetical protein
MLPTRRPAHLAGPLLLALALAPGCRKHSAPRPPAGLQGPGAITCPRPEELARMVQENGREARADCVVYAPGFFWLAAALSYDQGSGANPRLSLIYGGGAPTIFEGLPVDGAALTALIKANAGQDLRVSIRKPSRDSKLVRVGVYGQHGGDHPVADEQVMVLRLVAHAPPEVLWTGPGDQIRTEPSGCVSERTVDFEMPFAERLEMTTAQRAHPRDASSKQPCPAAPSGQATVDYKPRPLPPSRPLTRK